MTCITALLLAAQEKATFAQVSRPVIPASRITMPQTYAATDVKVLGDLDYGKSSGSVLYSSNPPYRAFIFSAFGGETVEITVKGASRKAMVALADSSLTRLAFGDTSLRLSLPYRGPLHRVLVYRISGLRKETGTFFGAGE